MNTGFQRRKYFIHPSSQLKYIAMSVLPALLTSVFCIYFLVRTGELALQAERAKLSVEITSFNSTIQELKTEQYPKPVIDKIQKLKKELISLNNILSVSYFDTLTEWNKTKALMFVGLFFILIFVGAISLLYSHRIAGPIVRLKNYIDLFSEGKDVPNIQIRHYDEFKELADSLENLRSSLKSKGILK